MSDAWSRRFGGEEIAPVPTAVTDSVLAIADYESRSGYDPGFLGAPLALPGLGAWKDDAVRLVDEALTADRDPTELRYTHFSTKQSGARRQPLFSAVNISGGATQRGLPRTNLWRRDPRIPLDRQIHRQSYGAVEAGLFSRGHMTRREDPNWGDLPTAKQADADTFHVTNACPQQQNFNGGIWLELENYVLDNVDREDLRVSVLTGPVFAESDPTYKGVKVPVDFWKIVVFNHPELQRPAAIAYRRSQASSLPRPRFVFGDFEDTQVSIRAVQQDTGLDFSAYVDLDVLAEADPAIAIRLNRVEDAYLSP